MNTIIWKRKALKQLDKLPVKAQEAITDALDELEISSNINGMKNVTALKNHPYDYRLRVGRYRVLFDYVDQLEIAEIYIEEVKKRDDQTY